MSKQPPFEELDQRWSDLPLPDADASWKDMSARLDEEDRKRPPLLTPFLSACAGWSLLLLVLSVGAIGLYWYTQRNGKEVAVSHPGPSRQGTASNPTTPSSPAPVGAGESSPQNPAGATPGTEIPSAATAGTPGTRAVPPSSTQVPSIPAAVATQETGSPNRKTTAAPSIGGPSIAAKKAIKTTGSAKNENRTPTAAAGIAASSRAVDRRRKTSGQTLSTPPSDGPNNGTGHPASTPRDTTARVAKSAGNSAPTPGVEPVAHVPETPKPDSLARVATPAAEVPADSLAIAKTVDAAKKKAARAPWLSAGVGISQAIPVGGQQAGGANYQGKTNPLTEHVPAGWLRVHKGRWFLQAEARFNAPQLLPAFAFSQKTRFDTLGHAVQTERQQLRKAWYHQFPVSINYQVLPRLSVGAGMQWSVLYRAAGERSLLRRDLGSGNVNQTATVFQVPCFRDSFLYKSQWQLLVQTEFNWRRWGLGLRYRTDLEPFLRYTSAEGELRNVYNESFEATLRFRLWQSKRRR